MLNIAERLRSIRVQKNLSQGDIEERSGLLRCYISRVENGHTVPCVETLERIAGALEIPIYEILYDGESPPELSSPFKAKKGGAVGWASRGRGAKLLRDFQNALGQMSRRDRQLLLLMAHRMIALKGQRGKSTERHPQ